jgi:hypothetical protein
MCVSLRDSCKTCIKCSDNSAKLTFFCHCGLDPQSLFSCKYVNWEIAAAWKAQ